MHPEFFDVRLSARTVAALLSKRMEENRLSLESSQIPNYVDIRADPPSVSKYVTAVFPRSAVP